MWFEKFIGTFFSIGYSGKGAGRVAAFFVCLFLYVGIEFNFYSDSLLFYFTLVFFVGTWMLRKIEKVGGKDNKSVVTVEVLGMAATVFFLPINLFTISPQSPGYLAIRTLTPIQI